ncbi:alpha-N-arabinofuranosidase [candidate division KSB1 bacterium]|nr:alpha-N-arabinofuranosidase [candidate division KSB1 bacterium]RQW05545.1 MAG: alpha-N-arabinofuranosidase [candidate division KSB1 bacterium]
MKVQSYLVLAIMVLFLSTAFAQNALDIYANAAEHRINKNIYGHFAEHLGRCIYDGIWVGPDSDIPNVNGYRKDVLEALQALEIPVLRWPGGCFADTYHWMDGIGPVEKRPKIKNVFWGGVIEDNSFGTHEFLNLCELLGCDAYVSANVSSGTVEEMIDWIVYMTSDDDVEMANLRRQNGREEPWDVKFIGIGNESWGCGGEMTPEHYADLMKTYSSYARHYGGRDLVRVGSGANSGDYNWTRVLMEEGARFIDALGAHYYTIAGEGWHNKSSATDFGEALYFRGIQQGLRIDELVSTHAAIMDQYDRRQRVGLFIDEWGIWTNVEPGTNPGFLYQQNSLRDALIAATTLNIFNQHCDRVRMANIAQTVNVLQAMILTEGDRMLRTPTYHVFNMYKGHKNALLLPSHLVSEDYEFDGQSIPAISSSTSLSDDGTITMTVSNANPNKAIALEITVVGKMISSIQDGAVLTAPAVNSINTFDQPDVVKPAVFKAFQKESDHVLTVELPSKSVVALSLQCK